MKRRAKLLALLGIGSVIVSGVLYWRFRLREIDPPMTQSRSAPKLHESERIIHFPEDEAIGNVFFSDGPYTRRDSGRIAKGLVAVPVGTHVTLDVDNSIHDLNRFAAFSATGEAEKIEHLRAIYIDERLESDPTVSSWLHHWTALSVLDLQFIKERLRADEFKGMDKLTSLRDLSINVTEIDDNALMEIGKARSIEGLRFARTQIADGGLRHLAGLHNLRSLSIDYAQIKGDGLPHLQSLPELRHLSLSNTPLTDAAVDHLLAFPQLELLMLLHTDISDVGVLKLAGAPHLYILDVRKTAVTQAGVLSFTRVAPHCYLLSDFPLPPTPTPRKPSPVS